MCSLASASVIRNLELVSESEPHTLVGLALGSELVPRTRLASATRMGLALELAVRSSERVLESVRTDSASVMAQYSTSLTLVLASACAHTDAAVWLVALVCCCRNQRSCTRCLESSRRDPTTTATMKRCRHWTQCSILRRQDRSSSHPAARRTRTSSRAPVAIRNDASDGIAHRTLDRIAAVARHCGGRVCLPLAALSHRSSRTLDVRTRWLAMQQQTAHRSILELATEEEALHRVALRAAAFDP